VARAFSAILPDFEFHLIKTIPENLYPRKPDNRKSLNFCSAVEAVVLSISTTSKVM